MNRIRHYGLNANTARRYNLARARDLLGQAASQPAPTDGLNASETDQTGEAVETRSPPFICPECGAAIVIVESFAGTHLPRAPPGWGPGP